MALQKRKKKYIYLGGVSTEMGNDNFYIHFFLPLDYHLSGTKLIVLTPSHNVDLKPD